MLTRDELSKLLKDVNAAEVARVAGVSLKTVYRLRHQANPPNLGTIERLVSAVRQIRAMKKGAA